MKWLQDIIKYAPVMWLGVKTLWQLYKARLIQRGMKEAFEHERDLRIQVERDLDLEHRLDEPFNERRDRVLRHALEAELERRRQSDNRASD